MQALEDSAKDTKQEMLAAAQLAYECMAYLSAHDTRVAMPVTQFLAFFRAAVTLTLQQVSDEGVFVVSSF